MPLAKTNHQTQPGHPSWMLLPEANHQSQPDHPSRMPLAETDQTFVPVIHLGCH
jgi:hypothetical protein